MTLTGARVTLTGVPPDKLGPRPGPRSPTIGGEATDVAAIASGVRQGRSQAPTTPGFYPARRRILGVGRRIDRRFHHPIRPAGGTPVDAQNVFYYPSKFSR